MTFREALERMDPAELGELVGRAYGKAPLPVRTWRVTPLTGGAMGAPVCRVAGDTLEEGAGHGGPWSLVAKRCAPPAPGGARPPGSGADAGDGWRRAVLAYRAGILPQRSPSGGPEGLTAARFLGAVERENGSVWLWTEDLGAYRPARWTADVLGLAARHLGRFNAAPLVSGRVPQHPWLARDGPRWWVESVLGRWTLETIPADAWASPLACALLAGHLIERIAPHAGTWENPLLGGAYPPATGARLLVLWKDRFRLLDGLARVPQTLCHGDPNPGNLFIRTSPSGSAETVAIDWDLVGLGALGEDAGHLLATALLAAAGGGQKEQPGRLHDAIFGGYLSGLADAGWRGDQRPVRFAFCANAALHVAPISGIAPAAALSPVLRESPYRQSVERVFGPAERLARPWAAATGLLLDLADDARTLLAAL